VSQYQQRWGAYAMVIALTGVLPTPRPLSAAAAKHEFEISAHKYAYRVAGVERAEIHVHEGEIVHITFSTEDIPHSLTIDGPYRISKRAAPGKPVTFEFLADKPGTFDFYCNLAIDERCRKELRGTFIVDPR
jgi:heme/copper-type cytochrome/quinol oxidase subunit 2